MSQKPEFHDRMLSLGLARVAEQAAIASAALIGNGDEKAADQAAVNAMREQLNLLDIAGVVVIGEGERDEAPMLLHRRRSGHRQRPWRGHRTGPAGRHNADRQRHAKRADRDRHGSTRLYAARARHLYGQAGHRPGLCGRRCVAGNEPERARVEALAKAKGCDTSDITVCILERPRHEEMIAEVRATGASIRLITDGDVAGVMHCAEAEETGIDMYMGRGGAPEGVLAAAALKCMGGQMWGRLVFRNDDERARAAKTGITDLDRIYSRDEMVTAGCDLCRNWRDRRLAAATHQAHTGLGRNRPPC